MVCDFLRACYQTQARLTAGQPERLSTIRWYWAAQDAQPLPHPSAVVSRQWTPAEEREDQGIGELLGATRSWRDGRINGRPPGTEFHGDASWYVDGAPQVDSYPRTLGGIPIECLGPLPFCNCKDGPVPTALYAHVLDTAGTAVGMAPLFELLYRQDPAARIWSCFEFCHPAYDHPTHGQARIVSLDLVCPVDEPFGCMSWRLYHSIQWADGRGLLWGIGTPLDGCPEDGIDLIFDTVLVAEIGGPVGHATIRVTTAPTLP